MYCMFVDTKNTYVRRYQKDRFLCGRRRRRQRCHRCRRRAYHTENPHSQIHTKKIAYLSRLHSTKINPTVDIAWSWLRTQLMLKMFILLYFLWMQHK
jgi:hypothetical protein